MSHLPVKNVFKAVYYIVRTRLVKRLAIILLFTLRYTSEINELVGFDM